MEYLSKLHFNNSIFSNIAPIFSNTSPKLLLNRVEKKVAIVAVFIFSAIALLCFYYFSRNKIKELQAKNKQELQAKKEPQVNKEQQELQARKAQEELQTKKEQQELQTKKEQQEQQEQQAKKEQQELQAKAKKEQLELQAKKEQQELQAKKAQEELQAKAKKEQQELQAKAKKAQLELQAKKEQQELQAKKAQEELQAKAKKEQQELQEKAKKEQLELQAKKEQQELQVKKEQQKLQALSDLTEFSEAWASYEKNPGSQEDMTKMLNCARNFFLLSRHSEFLPKFKELCHQILSSEFLPKDDSHAKTLVQLQLKKYLELFDFPIELLLHPAFHGEAYFLAAEQILKCMKENKVSEEKAIELFPKEMSDCMRNYSQNLLNPKQQSCYLLRISSSHKQENNYNCAVSYKDATGIGHGIIIYNSDSTLWTSPSLEQKKSLVDVLNHPLTKQIVDFVEDKARESTTGYMKVRSEYYSSLS